MKKFMLSAIISLSLLTSGGCSTNSTPVSVNTPLNLDKAYSKVIGQINAEKWNDALTSIEFVKDYKDGANLKNFILAKVEENKLDEKVTDAKGYQSLVDIIMSIPDDYQGESNDKISDFKSKIKNKIIQKELKEIASLINDKQYESALTLINASRLMDVDQTYEVLKNYLTAIRSKDGQYENPQLYRNLILSIPMDYNNLFSKEIQQLAADLIKSLAYLVKNAAFSEVMDFTSVDTRNKNKTVRALYDYYYALTPNCSSLVKNDCLIRGLAKISDGYNGILSNEIKQLQKKYSNEIQKQREFDAEVAAMPTLLEPTIGMNAEQVENSTWGKPNRINKTTTKYGTSDQWVYDYRGYIYLDDGKVTAIQSR
jgi:ribosomal protein L22